MVFVKDEGSKHKARERYIIVKIDGLHAEVQKLDDKSMSRRYKVSLTNLYPATAKDTSHRLYHKCDRTDPTSKESDDNDDDFVLYDGNLLIDDGSNPSDETEKNEDNVEIPSATPQRPSSVRYRQPLPGYVVVIMNSDPGGSASLRVTDGPFDSRRDKAPTTLYTTYIYILILQHSFF